MGSKLNSLEFSLTIGCKLDCIYCPQKLLLSRYYGEDRNRKSKLGLEDFKIALDKVTPGATISFCGMSEPFHNEECADMVAYAYQRGYKVCLLTTLVGMNRTDYDKIKDVKFESFVLHIPDKDNHSKFVIDENYLANLKWVNENIKIDYYSCHGTVHPAVKDFIDKEKFAGIQAENRAGNLDDDSVDCVKRRVAGEIVCYHGSEIDVGGWAPVMLPDGTLVLCCEDYGMKHELGNLLKQSWDEIQNGDEFKKFRKGLADDTIDILCRKCVGAKPVADLPCMHLKRAVDNWGREECKALTPEVNKLIERFVQAENICVFGLGKLWRDHFFQEHWDEGLACNVFSDNNAELQNTVIRGIPCVSPDELKIYPKLLVVLFVKNGEGILAQLEAMGITNCLLIDEVFKAANVLCANRFKNITK